MKELRITWKGVTPLIMHSCKCANPLHPLNVPIKKLSGKRCKTEDDYRALSDLEWLAGLYYDEDISNPDPTYLRDDMHIFIPAECIEASIVNGAKAYKKGKDIQKFVQMKEVSAPVDIFENKTLAEMWKDYKYRDVRQMMVQRNRITRTRPRFDRWKIAFTLVYDETKIDIETIANAIEYAGQYVGICDSRPKYGKYFAVIEELS